MKTIIICHDDAELDRRGLASWLSSFSDLVGIIIIMEPSRRLYKRIKKEIKRSGIFRFIDVLLFRLFYKIFLSSKDKKIIDKVIIDLEKKYPNISNEIQYLTTWSPNSNEALEFIKRLGPDLMLARCKTLLKKEIFNLPSIGTFVMHPGITPEYRNAYGCFWAIANKDYNNVGMTLLKIDEGVDTGAVYGYFTYQWDVLNESHITIQNNTVLKNLDLLKSKFLEIESGTAKTIDTSGRMSATWGQPWLSKYLQIMYRAKKGLIK